MVYANTKQLNALQTFFPSLTIRVIQNSVEFPLQERMLIGGSEGGGAHAVFGKNLSKQGSTPTTFPLANCTWGCGYGPGGGTALEGYGPGGGMALEGSIVLRRGVRSHQPPPPVNRLTDACENITSPQLLLWAVITGFRFNSGVGDPSPPSSGKSWIRH